MCEALPQLHLCAFMVGGLGIGTVLPSCIDIYQTGRLLQTEFIGLDM